jgi:hypothetical protein
MAIHKFLSASIAGAVLLGLTGVASPAFAAAPSVEVDLAGSGCSSVSELLIWGDVPAEEWLSTSWTDGSETSFETVATCGGKEFNVRWDQISLTSDSEVSLTIPSLEDVTFESKSGQFTSGWGASCIGSSYRVASETILAAEEWGSTSQPRISYTGLATLANNGTFQVSYPSDRNVGIEFPGTYDYGQKFYGQPDSDAGALFAEKCGATQFLSSEYGFPASIELDNQTALVEVNLNFPAEFDSSDCSWQVDFGPDSGYTQVYRGKVQLQGDVRCGEYSFAVNEHFGGTAGGEYSQEINVPALNLVTVSGTVNFAQSECNDFELKLSNSKSWDWSRGGGSSETTIEANGQFSITMPSGPVSFSVYSEQDTGFSNERENLCQIADGNLGFVQDDLGGVTLESVRDAVEVTLEQPNVNQIGDECTLYETDDERLQDPDFPSDVRTLGSDPAAGELGVNVYCGETISRTIYATYDSDTDNDARITVKVPDIKMKTITGTFTVPKGFPAAQVKNLDIWVRPDFNVATGRSTTWQFQPNVQLNVAKKKYTVTLPEGDYKFAIMSDMSPKKGCYVQTFYPDTTYQFAQGLRITSATAVAPRLNLLAGGRIRGNATFDERITETIDVLSDQIYNTEGVSYAWMAGDGTMVAENGDFFVYQCLPPGEYFYQAGNMWNGVKSQFYNNANNLKNATPVVIPSGGGDSARLSMHFLPMDAGVVSGTVKDDVGNALSDYTVVAYDRESLSWRSTQSAEDGSFRIDGLDTPGSYSVVAFDWNWGVSTTSSEYAYYPSNSSADAVMINITSASPSRSSLEIIIDGSLPGTRIVDLYPWFADMSIVPPAEDFDGMVDDLLAGDATVDVENVQLVEEIRNRARFDDWALEVEVNFNTSADDTVGAYGYPNGSETAVELGDLSASDDVVRVNATVDLEAGINFVTVTGNESESTVVVPILLGDVDPTMLTRPDLTGSLKTKKKVEADAGVWVASPAITKITYQWMSCSTEGTEVGCKPIKGAKKSKLTIPGSARGKYLALKVTATNIATSIVTIENFGRVR